jgi:hypothetical protein
MWSKLLYFKSVALLIVGLFAGFFLGRILPPIFGTHVDTQWRPIVVHGPLRNSVGYSTEVFDADLPLAFLTDATGNVKFLNDTGSAIEETEFGYLLNITMSDPDRSKIPEKYLKEEKSQANDGKEWTSPPIEHIDYGVAFHFTLKDKDNFELAKLDSDVQRLTTGKSDEIQGKIKKRVPYEIALKTKAVDFSMSVDKCYTCGSRQ